MIGSILIVLICSIPVCTGYAALAHWHWHLTSSRQEIDGKVQQRLRQLGGRALRSRDVPVASIVLYGDRTLGTGFNTVFSDSNAGGHAEINALSSAMRRVGPKAFAKLNRDSLLLITTFEPCPMCRGAILEYGVKRVIFLKGKPLLDRMREDWRAMVYEWRRTQRGPSALQDSLFQLHPDYPGARRRS